MYVGFGSVLWRKNMSVLSGLEPKRVFELFEEISAIPRGSGNRKKIADFCVAFADKNGLRAIRDVADNVIIFKDGTETLAGAPPVILQGHLDMVCQKTAESTVDFEKDGLQLLIDGDFIRADGTTLGADNGIAAAMILAILEDNALSHPPIEAVFTSDEEIGMVGAMALDASVLKGRRMINLDSEDKDCMTVSCAGGSDFSAKVAIGKKTATGHAVTVTLSGLRGGHSGICIHEGRVNANVLAGRFLQELRAFTAYDILSIDGGDKGNAIPLHCVIELCVSDVEAFEAYADKVFCTLKEEMSAREPNATMEMTVGKVGEYAVFDDKTVRVLVFVLLFAPNGVMDMSAEIPGLVETSLNLGILKTYDNALLFHFALRSNKKTALVYLENKLAVFFDAFGAAISTSGHYPPWEFNGDSVLQTLYIDTYKELFGDEPRVEAIHAGLECGVFADKLPHFDGIAIGPQMYDVHTTGERLEIRSVGEIYKLLTEMLAKCR